MQRNANETTDGVDLNNSVAMTIVWLSCLVFLERISLILDWFVLVPVTRKKNVRILSVDVVLLLFLSQINYF